MARQIDADSLSNRLELLVRRYAAQNRVEAARDYNFALTVLDGAPTVAAVPVSELLALRESLYETDRITMSGLHDLNMLIAKYAQGGKDHAPD